MSHVFIARGAMGKVPAKFLCSGAYSPFRTGRSWSVEDWFDTPLRK